MNWFSLFQCHFFYSYVFKGSRPLTPSRRNLKDSPKLGISFPPFHPILNEQQIRNTLFCKNSNKKTVFGQCLNYTVSIKKITNKYRMSQLQHSFHSYQFKTSYNDLRPEKTFQMKSFATAVNSKSLTIVAKLSSLVICGAPDYASSTK